MKHGCGSKAGRAATVSSSEKGGARRQHKNILQETLLIRSGSTVALGVAPIRACFVCHFAAGRRQCEPACTPYRIELTVLKGPDNTARVGAKRRPGFEGHKNGEKGLKGRENSSPLCADADVPHATPGLSRPCRRSAPHGGLGLSASFPSSRLGTQFPEAPLRSRDFETSIGSIARLRDSTKRAKRFGG